MVKILQEKFAHLGLTFAIGGQISFDVFPHGTSISPWRQAVHVQPPNSPFSLSSGPLLF
jgi:hypothetical protein